MTKEPGQPPKAVNIIRPSSNYGLLHNTTSTSSSGSSNGGSIVQKRNGSIHSNNSSILSSNRKPRVNSTVKVSEKPVLNLYHPPTRKPSYDDYHRSNSSSFISSLRPPIEIYNPQQQKQLQQQQQQQQQQRMTKSFTAPSLTSEQLQPIHPTAASATLTNNNYTRPISPSYIRPSHRSVLGPINAPVAATTITSTINNIEKSQDIAPIIVEPLVEPNDNTFLLLDNTIKTIDDEDSDNYEEDIDDDDNGEEEDEEEEEPVINEARVNRKIADLELSINSLLTVNAMLEATVRKQASQLSQMKNKMLSGESVDMILDEVSILDGDQKNDDDESDGEKEEDWEQDLVFQRLKKVTEYMIEQGQKSIDFEYKILGRVLSNYAPEEDDEDEDEDEDEEEDNTIEEKEEEKTLSLTPTSTTSSTATTTTTKNSIASSIPVPSSIPSNTTTTTTSTTNANTTTTRISKLAKRRIN